MSRLDLGVWKDIEIVRGTPILSEIESQKQLRVFSGSVSAKRSSMMKSAPFATALLLSFQAIAAPSTQPAGWTSLSVTTRQDTVFCRRFPDTISSDNLGLRVFAGNANVELTCWTKAAIDGPAGRVNQNGLWIKTSLGCYVKWCRYQSSPHFVGTLQSQYKREDCYSCPSLDCPSQNLGIGPLLDLDCSTEGTVVGGNNFWYKQVDENCFYPSRVFANTGFMGTKPQACLKPAS
ncbi:hypothetical protein E6O75_ATG05487 [Venturia nashicola]|uniref:Uncharacterized protein n=1 Tax=Venturia nashicola TaxID=86259 RepID=A0A4Z1NX53_9PEZI|nr:hypothetical protein E6O75_ATG05487 [Venturia nashicola]